MAQGILQLSHSVTPRRVTPAVLLLVWLVVVLPLPMPASLQWASWLAYLALLITPGYLLADILTGPHDYDELERLAMALPLGLGVMAVPGTVALVSHWTLAQLTASWIAVSTLVVVAWALWGHRRTRTPRMRLALDEWLMLLLLVLAVAAVFPTLTLYKIDGDAYAVGSFLVDALTNQPLNATEPLFGTGLGPGVRMLFNQHLTLNYLWITLAGVDPIDHAAAGSKAMLAVWAVLAAYALGRSAGNGNRRFAMLVAGIQLLIYLAAPFIRGDNVSIFFFERINADKFMVPTTMLPVIFALAIRYMRHGERRTWYAAAAATFAVSTIHPLIAALTALALGAFGATHILFNLRQRTARQRVGRLAALTAIVMVLPLVQLVLARGEAPLAASYPSSFDNWSIGERRLTVFPFYEMTTLDWIGPLPDMNQLNADAVNGETDPFLIWRFALNMERRRLVIFDLNSYISDPSLIMEPVYLLALVLLPMLLPRLRRSLSAQFAVGVTLGVLTVMFNPLVTPVIGSLVMPWILWRFVWLLPVALILALAAHITLQASARLWSRAMRATQPDAELRWLPLAFILLAMLASMPAIRHNLAVLHDRLSFPYVYPTPERIFARLDEAISAESPALVLADQDLSVTLAAYVAPAHILAHRTPTTSEIFPDDQQEIALQRLLDQNSFYRTPYLTADSVSVLDRYSVRYVIVPSGGSLAMQMHLAADWFTFLEEDEGYSLFSVDAVPVAAPIIDANSAMAARDWQRAESLYSAILADDPENRLALVGLGEVAHVRGDFDRALTLFNQAAEQVDLPILQYRLGQLYVDLGRQQQALTAFARAQAGTPRGARFHFALGDACWRAGDLDCAERQYRAGVVDDDYSSVAGSLVALADIWRERDDLDRAIPLYEAAVARRPSLYNRFLLASTYRNAGRIGDAEDVIAAMRRSERFSADPVILEADLRAGQGELDRAVDLYRHALWLQGWQMQDATATYVALAQVWYDAGELDAAQDAVEHALAITPSHADAHRLLGDLHRRHGRLEAARAAYQRSFELDPSQTTVYLALTDQIRQAGGTPADALPYLQSAIRNENRDATLLLSLGDFWLRVGDNRAAVDAYQFAVNQLNPYESHSGTQPQAPGAGRAFAYTRLATAVEDRGQIANALNYYRAAAVTAPDAPWAHLLLGDALRRQNRLADAEAAYRTALAKDNDYLDGYVRLSDLLFAIGQNEEAQTLLDRAQWLAAQTDLAQDAIEFSAVETPAFLLANQSDETLLLPGSLSNQSQPALTFDPVPGSSRVPVDDAARGELIRHYQEQIADGLAAGQTATSLSRLYKRLGDLYLDDLAHSTAAQAFADAVRLDPWWPEARLSLAEALTWLDETDAALAQLEQAALMSPGSVEAQVALANALERDGQSAEALTRYADTAAAHPGNGRATLALARAWQDRNRWDKAGEAYRATLTTNPGSADAYVGLAELAIDTAQLVEAERLLQSALQIDRRNISIYVRFGELAQRRGDAVAALAWYQQAATLPAADQALNLTLIDSLLRYGDHDTALEYTTAALRQRPGDAELLLRLGRIARVLGNFDEAAAALTESAERAPDNNRVYLEQAALYLDRGQPADAVTAYEHAIARAPQDASTYVAAAQLYATQGRFTNGLALLSSGLPHVDRPDVIYAAMSALQLQQGEPEFALETLRHGLRELGDDNTGMLLALGDYFASRGDFSQVETRYNQALAGQPDVADVHIALGNLYMLEADFAAAIASYRSAMALDPTTPSHALALANAYYVSGDWESAEAAYRQALTAAPTLTSAYRSLAELYIEQGRLEDAAATFERGLDVIPTSGRLLVGYARYWLDLGDQSQALDLLDRAVAVAPSAATRIERAAMLAEVGDSAEAERELAAAVAQEPGSIDALIALGDLYRARGDDDQAAAFYLQATEVMPGVPTGYLRLGQMAREREDRGEAVRFANLARDAEPGGLVPPDDTGDTP